MGLNDCYCYYYYYYYYYYCLFLDKIPELILDNTFDP